MTDRRRPGGRRRARAGPTDSAPDVRFAVDAARGQVVAVLRFETAVQEVFAVAVLPNRRWPELIHDDETVLENSFVVPDAALADVPAALRGRMEARNST